MTSLFYYFLGNSHFVNTTCLKAVIVFINDDFRVLSDLLMALGVSAETARADACRIEHDLSDETWEKIKQHAQDHLDSSAPGAHGIP